VGKDRRPVHTSVLDPAYRSVRSGPWAPENVDEEVAAE
jgi:hypothetical protein